MYGKFCVVETIVVVDAYAIQKSCFGVSGVQVASKQITMGFQPVEN
jgi:hypothetical protein